MAPASVNGVATTRLPVEGHLDEPVAHRAVQAQRRVRVDDRDERWLADEGVAVDAADEHRHLDRVVDHRRAGAEAVPRLVELGRERPVLVEVARLDRQVGRLQRAAALLVEDVEGADEPHVVDEVGEVARPPAAVEVADERRPADRAEDQVRATEEHVALGVPGVQPELARGRRHQRLDLRGIEADHPCRPIHLRSGPRQRVERPVAKDLHPDLREDAQRRDVDRLDLVGREDLDRAIRVDQPPPRAAGGSRAQRAAVDAGTAWGSGDRHGG